MWSWSGAGKRLSVHLDRCFIIGAKSQVQRKGRIKTLGNTSSVIARLIVTYRFQLFLYLETNNNMT